MSLFQFGFWSSISANISEREIKYDITWPRGDTKFLFEC